MFTVTGDIGNLFAQDLTREANPRMLVAATSHKIPTSASPDGRFVLYTVANMNRSRRDVWVLPLKGDSKPFALVQRDFDQEQAQFSPDGRWVAYASNESERYEVHVRRGVETSGRLSTNAETVVVSTEGGTAPRWRTDSKELYFIAADGTVMVTDVGDGAQLSAGVPRALFQIPGSHGDWDVAADGPIESVPEPTSRLRYTSTDRLRQGSPGTRPWSPLAVIQASSSPRSIRSRSA